MADPSPTAPAGSFETEDDGFLGGFDPAAPIIVPGGPRGQGWGVLKTETTSLAELREHGFGGYVSADQWEPANYPGPRVAQLQTMLVEAGLLDLDDLDHDALGYYDSATRNAYRELLTRANAAGASWDETLNVMRQNPVAMQRAPRGQQRAPFSAVVTHPEDVERGLKDYFREALGSGAIAEEKIKQMVAAYQGQQVAAQRSEYNAGVGGGTVQAPMNFDTFADIQAKIADPTAYDSRKVIGAADYLARKLKGEV